MATRLTLCIATTIAGLLHINVGIRANYHTRSSSGRRLLRRPQRSPLRLLPLRTLLLSAAACSSSEERSHARCPAAICRSCGYHTRPPGGRTASSGHAPDSWRNLPHGVRQHYPEEAPVHRVTVDGFWIDRMPVTNSEFRNSSTLPATSPSPKSSPTRRIIPAHCRTCSRLVAGLHPAEACGRPAGLGRWWNFKFGADWRRPYGPRTRSAGSTIIRSCMSHIAMRRLTPNGPARNYRPKPNGSLRRAADSTGRICLGRGVHARRQADGQYLAGLFPARESRADGFERTSPVRRFRRTATASTT